MDRKMFDIGEYYRESGGRSNARFSAERLQPADDDFDFCAMPERNNCDSALTMVFINPQPLDSVYPLQEAFCNGTLFPSLNKPFFGGKRK